MAARRRKKKANFIDDMAELPWQVNAVVMVVAFFGIKYIPPLIDAQSIVMRGLLTAAPNFAPLVAFIFLVPTVMSATSAYKARKSYPPVYPVSMKVKKPSGRSGPPDPWAQQQPVGKELVFPADERQLSPGTSDGLQELESLREAEGYHEPQKPQSISLDLIWKIEWKRFEELCRAYLEVKGGRAETTKIGPDGGVDINLFKDKSDKPFAIVQCKAWNAYKVGVKPVRELFGVMAAEGVSTGIFMNTGSYTREAVAFAKGKKLLLISGEDLVKSILEMPDEIQSKLLQVATEGDYTTPTCPRCDTKLTLKKVSSGKNAGNEFWGCRSYPRCRVTLKYKPEMA
ncbi:restriction endonuclease [Mariprofundus ferrooxydans]|uniref:Mrr restriction system protein, putative n=1 Tax=Mariprofundus ferrooxydans PV-1 TaxID=314345 RepID=Q0F390_9PROT|nr:restriction endonuclease [Mariprofundus ferrooxydans]EAU56051.1 Mrr restriction system protein, putative [Mariprofundus ferrooxydans PV-1]KON46638.1 restriction endonuclease [Mariprofundus ferrooxydans]